MKKTRFTQAPDHRCAEGSGGRRSGQELCRKHGISDATYYNWKAEYGGMTESEAAWFAVKGSLGALITLLLPQRAVAIGEDAFAVEHARSARR